MLEKTVYYVITRRHDTGDWDAEPRRGEYSNFHGRLNPDPYNDPISEDAPAFISSIYGNWPGQAAGHLRREVNAWVQVYWKRADPITGTVRYLSTG